MPELPQVEATQNLKVPETVGIQRLNLERPNPALEAASQGGKNLEYQMSFLGASLQRQKLATDLLNSESQTVQGFTTLRQQTAGIADPDTRLKALDVGSQDVINDILKANPSLAPHVADQLNLRRMDFMQQSQIETQTAKHAIGQANYKASLDQLAIAAGSPDLSHQDELVLKEQGLQRIDQAVANADITEAQAISDKADLIYKIQLNKLNGSLTTPNGVTNALSISQKDSGLTGTDFLSFKNRAVEQANHEYDTLNGASRINNIQNLVDFDAGKIAEPQAFQMVQRHEITPAQYANRFGHPPDNVGARTSIINHLNGFTNPEDLENYIANNVAGNSSLTADDKAEIHANATDRLQDLRTEAGQRKSEVKFNLSIYPKQNYPELYTPGTPDMPNPNTAKRGIVTSILQAANAQIRLAKTPEEEIKAAELAQTRIDKLMTSGKEGFGIKHAPAVLPKASIGVE